MLDAPSKGEEALDSCRLCSCLLTRTGRVGVVRGADAPLLFDEDYREKPAYLGVRDAITARAAMGPVV